MPVFKRSVAHGESDEQDPDTRGWETSINHAQVALFPLTNIEF